MLLLGSGFFLVFLLIVVLGRLSELGHIPYRIGAPFEQALKRLPAFLFFGGLVFSFVLFFFFDHFNGGADCFIDWDGRSNPLSC